MDRSTLLSTPTGRAAALAIGLLALGVAIGLAVLWPRGESDVLRTDLIRGVTSAEVLTTRAGDCESYAGPGCRVARILLRSGPDAGRQSFLTLSGNDVAPDLSPGERIRVVRNAPPEGERGAGPPLDDPAAQPFSFYDYERRLPLLWVALAFGAVVVALGRMQGLRSLIGLGLALVLVFEFIVPAILHGRSPVAVALVGGLAVMLATMLLTHGPGLKSAAAMLGTAAALLVTVLLAIGAVELTHITGLSSEQVTFLQIGSQATFSPEGLVIAGIVVATLGVLDDVTISQSSTVLALRRANPGLPFARLFREALSVGRDHLGATVNTLVLAYAGAALPVLLVFSNQRMPFDEAVNGEPVAEEIVAMLVGSMGLVFAVPLTTALAALLASHLPAAELPADEHVH